MKKLLPLLFLLPVFVFAQTYNEQLTGSVNYHTQYKGGIGADKTLKIPVTDVTSIPGFTMKGLLKINATGGYIEYHDGTSWVRLVDTPFGTSNYKSLSYVPAWSEITGKPTFFSGAYSDLTGKPSLFSGNYNDLTNLPSLFSGSYNDLSDKPNLALYYLASNPNGYISNLSSFTTSNLTEGSNLYWTSARFNTAFSGKSSSDLTEGTNLYWTASRFNTAFSGKSTTDLAEGSRLYYTDSRARNSISAGTGLSYNSSTGVMVNSAPDQTVTLTAGTGVTITGTYPNFTISVVQPAISIATRTLNSNFTPSATRNTIVSYTVTCSVTNPLLVGTSTATAYLEYSTNGGSTWLLPSQTGNSSGVGVAVAIQLTNGQTGTLVGTIPSNALTRIRTATSGTATVTYVTGTETNL